MEKMAQIRQIRKKNSTNRHIFTISQYIAKNVEGF
jgi:hypothetical protein